MSPRPLKMAQSGHTATTSPASQVKKTRNFRGPQFDKKFQNFSFRFLRFVQLFSSQLEMVCCLCLLLDPTKKEILAFSLKIFPAFLCLTKTTDVQVDSDGTKIIISLFHTLHPSHTTPFSLSLPFISLLQWFISIL